jgi:hypothetical protein
MNIYFLMTLTPVVNVIRLLSLKLECLSIESLSLLVYIYECGWSLPKQRTLLHLRMNFSQPQNIRPPYNILPMTNTLASFVPPPVRKTSYMPLTPGSSRTLGRRLEESLHFRHLQIKKKKIGIFIHILLPGDLCNKTIYGRILQIFL